MQTNEKLVLNLLECKGNYSATSNNMKLVHLMGGLLHLVHRGEAWASCGSTHSPLIAVPNVTAHPSTASVPITVLLYNGPLLCGFNVPIKELNCGHGQREIQQDRSFYAANAKGQQIRSSTSD